MNIGGLPLHPLIVHVAVVLVPLSALGGLVLSWRPGLRARFGWLTVAFAAAGAAGALAARLTGPALASQIGIGSSPQFATHRMWGLWAPWPALVLALSLAALVWSDSGTAIAGGRSGRRTLGVGPPQDRRTLRLASTVVVVVSALASLVLVTLVGHSGATLVWGGR
ncbi:MULTISPECIES: DUF2231 domain-containing protein [Aestuariimicrobium]|uniref:DUF2231 domain-containing protein n=1 Tax=Aestuariimicrobium TaxID=396388 RepID=UPI0003B4FDA8|nr:MULTISPECIES: DUF2231 domain-containing protein [Aestuariimicrobium]CAI9403542.1 hypothetical protein AESSP_01025 [Aestuariimicrobium sp. T2.26MG-19.2B]